MAVEDAALDPAKVDATRFGVLIGSGIGGISTLIEGEKVLNEKGPDRVSPFVIPMLIVNMAAGLVSMRFGAKGAELVGRDRLRHRQSLDRRRRQDHRAGAMPT
jgi:3-oxoacyl-[acyl-carrier-protein] synthase II